MARDEPKVNIRLSQELKDKLHELAAKNKRSANAEMVAAIEAWVQKNRDVQQLDMASIAERIAILEDEVKRLKKE